MKAASKYRILHDRWNGVRIYRPQKLMFGIYWRDLVSDRIFPYFTDRRVAQVLIDHDGAVNNSKKRS